MPSGGVSSALAEYMGELSASPDCECECEYGEWALSNGWYEVNVGVVGQADDPLAARLPIEISNGFRS